MRQLKITKKITQKDSNSINNYFSEINKIKLLTDAEEKQLLEQIENGSDHAINKLVEANLRFVISVAKQYQCYGVTLEDLINEGNIGLIKAAKKFDRSRGFRFISYAVWWIRQCITQYIYEHSRLVRIPTNQNINISKLNKKKAELEQRLHREPTLDELKNEFSDDKNYKNNIEDILNIHLKHLSLDTPISSDDSNNNCLIDVMPNNECQMPDENMIADSFKKDLEKILNKLDYRQKNILCMYFGLNGYQPMTLEEIGSEFNLTRERVRQIKDNTLRILKCKRNSNVLRQHIM